MKRVVRQSRERLKEWIDKSPKVVIIGGIASIITIITFLAGLLNISSRLPPFPPFLRWYEDNEIYILRSLVPLLLLALIFRSRIQKLLRRKGKLEHDFTSGLGNWKVNPSDWEPAFHTTKGVKLPPHAENIPDAPSHRLHEDSRFLYLTGLLFVDGEVQCELILEPGAVFNIMLRGDRQAKGFYMARLDSRKNWYDCILEMKPGEESWETRNGSLEKRYSPKRTPIRMRVKAQDGQISFYREVASTETLVHSIEDARRIKSTIMFFAQEGNVYVKWIKVQLR